MESYSYKITNDGAVVIDDVEIPLSISEKYDRFEHVPSKEEQKEMERNRYFHGVPEWDYIPTGKLQFIFKIEGARGFQKKWADSSIRQLEDIIGKIIIGGIKAAKAYQIEQKDLEEWRRKWQMERLQREKEALRRAEEKRHLELLEDQADYWAKAERLRAFISAVEQSGIERVLKGENEIGIQEWLSWARRHADRIDPLVSVEKAE